MSKANLKRWAFNLFLKSVMSETVRKSAGRESSMPLDRKTRWRALRACWPKRLDLLELRATEMTG